MADAPGVVGRACRRTGQVAMEGGDEARHFAGMLVEIRDEPEQEPAVAEVMRGATDTLARRSSAAGYDPDLQTPDDADTHDGERT